MAELVVFRNVLYGFVVPPGGTLYFVLGPHPRFGSGAIAVTAHTKWGVSYIAPDYVEVIQMATRRQPQSGTAEDAYFLDIVVRNNDQQGNIHEYYEVYTSVAT